MYGLGWFLELYTNQLGEVQSLPFFLLVLSTIMIAAAGNIINDYFDVRADRINKPDRVIIGKYLKRRVAIATHWVINFFAFGIAVYLSWTYNTFWYLFVHLFSINLLWYYSTYFKRQFLIGNIIVAFLTALVPLLVGFYFYHLAQLNQVDLSESAYQNIDQFVGLKNLILSIAIFAFLINLAREVVKDIEDMEGDKMLKSKTIPIVLGEKNSKIVGSIIILFPIGMLIGIFYNFSEQITTYLPLALAACALLLTSLILLIKASSRSNYRLVNNCLKLAMICGLLLPVFFRYMNGQL
jgi:4-hydroxybenzoate polyprenyltransferase